MSFTFKGYSFGSGATNSADGTGNYTGTAVSAGDLVVAWCLYEGAGLTATLSDTASGWNVQAENTSGWTNGRGRFIYTTNSLATGSPNYILTVTGATGPMFILFVFTPSSTPTFDNEIHSNGSIGGSTSVDSTAFTAVSGDTLVVGGGGAQTDGTPVTAFAIGGSSATTNAQAAFFQGDFTIAEWYLATSGSVAATATLNTSLPWLANAISFNIAAGAPSTIITSSTTLRVPGARRTMILPG